MDDLISRQAAMNIADDIRDCISVDGYWAWMERLKALPTAEPKRGRWDVRYDEEYAEDGIVICSECGEIYANEGFYWYKAHFCPNCGCRMTEGEEDDRE